MKKILIIFLLAFISHASFSQNWVAQFNKTVAFLHVYQGDTFAPQGTGFLISIPAKVPNRSYVYLVTAKHVLMTPDKKNMNLIFARFNTKDTSEMFHVSLVWSGTDKTVYVHPDESVDIAVIPIIVPSHLEYRYIGLNQIIRKEHFDSLNINVGTQVFFSGLFTSYIGTKRINPIFRFGRLCLLPEERIEFDGYERDIHLIESSSFGGNSGSPVIFQYNNNGGETFVGLGGVVLGRFNQGQVLGKMNNENVVAWSSLGISAITPAGYILDILNNPELTLRRTE